ncbi:amino acid transporter, putative [Leishmania tarentolae]|uniref:Amino acid transporter, putative n=1 Tax=Leishmania tarentolae TaxID=5689 RepID=A0A640KH11_LEITA|nr:amino acid transporter, putative [Leishmania tarentolae]
MCVWEEGGGANLSARVFSSFASRVVYASGTKGSMRGGGPSLFFFLHHAVDRSRGAEANDDDTAHEESDGAKVVVVANFFQFVAATVHKEEGRKDESDKAAGEGAKEAKHRVHIRDEQATQQRDEAEEGAQNCVLPPGNGVQVPADEVMHGVSGGQNM